MTRGFWDQRRAAVAAEARAEAEAVEAARRAEVEARQAEKSDEQLLQELGLPDPDALVSGDDVRAFLRDGIPARLKARALRRLWRTNPVLANLDGLNDYDDDYTDAGTVVGTLKTAYQVGKGMMPQIEKLAAAAKAAAAEAAEAAKAAGEVDPEAEPEVAPAFVEAVEEPEADATPEPETADDLPATPVRRMQFSFPTEGAA